MDKFEIAICPDRGKIRWFKILKAIVTWLAPRFSETTSVTTSNDARESTIPAPVGAENDTRVFSIVTFSFLDGPEGQVRLFVEAGDSNHFAHMFAAASNKIPLSDGEILRAHWATQPHCPIIVIQDADFLDVPLNGGVSKAIGANVNGHGFSFRFAGRAMMQMPPQYAETLIAHEFAHPVQTLLLVDGALPEAERAACERLMRESSPEAVTEWQETFTDARTLSWHPELNSSELRIWLREFLATDDGQIPYF